MIKEIYNMKFFNPTSELKELLLLQHIESKPDTTQKEIASVVGCATSMVNVYIDNLEEKDYMIRDYKSSKIVNYHITSEGIKRKNYLLIVYMRELINLYQLAKNNVKDFLNELEDKGYKNILLYGAGEVAETIIGVIRDRDTTTLNVLALVDDNAEKINEVILGYKVVHRDSIKEYEHDAIVITSYTFEDEIRNRLAKIEYPGDRIVRFFGE